MKLKFLDFFYKCVFYSFQSLETKLKVIRLLFQKYRSSTIYETFIESVLHDENLINSLPNAKINACVGSTFCTLLGTKLPHLIVGKYKLWKGYDFVINGEIIKVIDFCSEIEETRTRNLMLFLIYVAFIYALFSVTLYYCMKLFNCYKA